MRLLLVVIALVTAFGAQAHAGPPRVPELIRSPHIISIVYCTSCACFGINAKRIVDEIKDYFPNENFESILTPRQGNELIPRRIDQIKCFFRLLWRLCDKKRNDRGKDDLVSWNKGSWNRKISRNLHTSSSNQENNLCKIDFESTTSSHEMSSIAAYFLIECNVLRIRVKVFTIKRDSFFFFSLRDFWWHKKD